jgi:predicted transcriptional regulator
MSDLESTSSRTILDEVRDVQEAGLLHVKGYSNHEIASLLSIPINKAKNYVQQYKELVNQQAENDPYFLEKLQYNTLKALDEFDQISKEAWETVSIATDHGMVAQRIQALKLAGDIATKKAQLHKLMSGGNNADAEYIQRMQKAENVNQILSKILRDVISKHPEIAEEVRKELSLAFEIMNEEDTFPDRDVYDVDEADIDEGPADLTDTRE